MSGDLTLAMRLFLDAQRFVQGFGQADRVRSSFTSRTKAEFSQLRESVNATRNRLQALGVGFVAGAVGVQSARLDKSLEQIGLTAGADQEAVRSLRRELFGLAYDTGQQVEDLQQGFGNLIASGLDWTSSLEVIRATNKAMAVTNAQADALTGSLSVAQTAFEFDLAKPKLALDLLDKMTVAGRLGNAELENLASIFARVGPAASAAGMDFDTSLAFIETLSLLERAPERLSTLAESTLRLFTNDRYRKEAQRATGVRFFDANGERRDALKVLSEMQVAYSKLTTDRDRERYITKAFSKADLDTIKGMRLLLGGDMLAKVSSFSGEISSAAGTLDRDLDRALSNSVDQVGRLKAALRDAADDFARPFKWAIENGTKMLLDDKQEAGLHGWGLLTAGAAAFGGGYLAKRYLGSGGALAAGVAQGKALEAAAGVTPVYVTNLPKGGMGGALDAGVAAGVGALAARGGAVFSSLRAAVGIIATTPLKNLWTLGAGGVAGAASAAAGAGLAGYGAGSLLYKAIDETAFSDKLGEAIARALSALGSDSARAAVNQREKYEGLLRIQLDDNRTRVVEAKTSSDFELAISQGGGMFSLP